jgi:hypothetical protein
MPLEKDSACIATPGFSGFIPSMRYQIGQTYGNASRMLAHVEEGEKGNHMHGHHVPHHQLKHDEEEVVWDNKHVVSNVDDRHSFPPVPGYTVNFS